MKLQLLVFSFCAWIFATDAFGGLPNPFDTVQSYSRQFTVREIKGRPSRGPSPIAQRVPIAGNLAFLVSAPPPSLSASPDKIPLEPATLAVSCERTKELLLQTLGKHDDWQGGVEVIINPALATNQNPSLTAWHRPGGWDYTLELPKQIQPAVLVQALVQTLLTEMADRGAKTGSVEIPYWLSEGLSAHLQSFSCPTFIARPNMQLAGPLDFRIEGLDGVRQGLQHHAPLTFQQLSWPESCTATAEDRAAYRSCAQLFVESLMQFEHGPAKLQRMLDVMPQHLNWQTAFLEAFHPHFGQLLDVEKWWDLNCVEFTTAELTGPRTVQECWRKLRNALDVPVEVRLKTTRLPVEARLTLQEVIRQWKPAEATAALARTVRDLEGLQLSTFRYGMNLDAGGALLAAQNIHDSRLSQRQIDAELKPLINSYLSVLLNYLKQCQSEPFDIRSDGSRLQWLKRETVQRLNDLDQKRAQADEKMRQAKHSPQLSEIDGHGTRPVSTTP